MRKKIKIGDIVVYSPSLAPVVGKVVGCFDDHITVDIGDHILNWKAEDCCPITEEEYNRFRKLKGELEMATNLSSEETIEFIKKKKAEQENER